MSSPLKIFSYNLHMLPRMVLLPGRRRRAHGIVAELRKCDFDILVFQEAFFPPAVNIIWEGLKDLYPHRCGPTNNTFHIKGNSGLWILSKTPLAIKKTLRFEHSSGMDKLVRKGAMLVEGQCEGETFQIINTHLNANDKEYKLREEQLKAINEELIKPFEVNGIPQFICADMNIGIGTPYYIEMLEILNAQNGPLSGELKFTFDGHNNHLAHLNGYDDTRTTYDYILLRDNGKKIRDINRHIEILKHDGKDLSDHYAMCAEIEW